MIKTELLAPAGNMDKLKTAIYFGADAVYVGGKDFSLRSYSDNFTEDQLKEAIGFVHDRGKKLYVTLNIFAKNADFDKIADYAGFVYSAGADAVIVSDPGVFAAVRKICPDLNLHFSTQATPVNKYSAAVWPENGAKRIILARELSLKEIAEIRAFLPADVEVEAFCHGAMCISYSGRCLLSDYYTGRQSNRGECVQACRWKYAVRPYDSDGAFCDVEQDEKGTYFFNSKDLNMIGHLDEMVNSGVYSFKIEGRMKSEYYLATVVNAYRRALDALSSVGKDYKKDGLFESELLKTNHRAFTTAYMLGDNRDTVNYDDS
ncbi:MAG: U32 family peptidase, partial [Clostridia bacterium]|nr:U32 family peptidase [Clostridia bacterium]